MDAGRSCLALDNWPRWRREDQFLSAKCAASLPRSHCRDCGNGYFSVGHQPHSGGARTGSEQLHQLTQPLKGATVKSYLITAGVALAAYAAVSFLQREVGAVPMVGKYLPN